MTLYRLRVILILLIAALQNTAYSQTTSSGAKNNFEFNFDWKFFLGDIPSAAQKDFDDSKWRKLDLLHDFSIEQPFDLKHESGWRGAF